MNRLQFASLFMVAVTSAGGGALAGLLPGDNGYQYDRPAFVGDFGRRTNDGLTRFPGARPSGYYGSPTATGNFGDFPRQPGGSAFGFPGYQGYRGNNPAYQGYQGFSNDGSSGFLDYNGANNRPRPYSFQYEVQDPPSGNDYGQQESGDGNGSVRGEYRVLLPDSRTQIVRYTADDASGYVADVRYEGQVQYPRPGVFSSGRNNALFSPAVGNVYQPGRGVIGGFSGGAADEFGSGSGGGSFAGGNQYLPPGAGSFGK